MYVSETRLFRGNTGFFRSNIIVNVINLLSVYIYLCVDVTFAKGGKKGASIPKGNGTCFTSILDEMKADNIKENLRYFTEYPHHPGSNRSKELAQHIIRRWRKSGFDKTEVFRYNILLSYPKSPGEISLRKEGKVKKKLVIDNEPPFDDSEKKGKVLYPFNAFSPKGTVTAEFVYCNYGKRADFETLRKLGVVLSGKILIIRYGEIYRGSKVRLAELHGAVGVILFSDPFDHTYPGREYPNGWTLNRYGVQRGTINRLSGDALSIGYPSKPKYFRLNATRYSGNPKIPSQPISYSTAYEILKFMKNNSIPLPSGFQGGLNFTYVLSSGKGRTVTLKVDTVLETRESLTVCTTLFGKTEPDRYVVLGNHRDSWSYGSSDASSGTSTVMEIVRSIGQVKKKTGWRPRRSIMVCSWGAEEPGALGSTEWADENHQFIQRHVAMYINADMVVDGNFTVGLRALDSVVDGVYTAAKFIKAPYNPEKSLYDDWLKKSRILAKNKKLSKPGATIPSDLSDFEAFWNTYGTTVSDVGYEFSERDYPRFSSNGQYHTRYDSFGWMTKYIDPSFVIHLAIGQLCAGHSLLIADSTIMPFNLISYVEQVGNQLDQFEEIYKSILNPRNISLSFARERLHALIGKTKLFRDYVNYLDFTHISAYELRSINDKLMNFERNFLLTDIVKNKATRHVIYASTPTYLKKETKFPGISEAIYFASKSQTAKDWDEVRKQITLVVWCFDTANHSLDFDEWRK